MKIRYLGHSCFLMEEKSRFVTDPYTKVGYEMPRVSADFITCSHAHFDHDYFAGVTGVKKIIDGEGEFEAGGVRIAGKKFFHDASRGARRGTTIAYSFYFGDTRVCHLGDLGEPFSQENAAKIGRPDILMIPVGGTYTIDAAEAKKYIDAISPDIVIPMHYRTQKCTLDIAPLSEFLAISGRETVVFGALDTADLDKYKGKIIVMEVRENE